jgi:hypothetical protein
MLHLMASVAKLVDRKEALLLEIRELTDVMEVLVQYAHAGTSSFDVGALVLLLEVGEPTDGMEIQSFVVLTVGTQT